MYDYYMAHHGIKGQSWGERNGPPYPLTAKQHAAVVKSKSIEKGSLSDTATKVTSKAKEIISTRKAKKEERKNQKIDAKKANAIKSGSVKEINKYKSYMTNQELNDALTRVNLEQRISQIDGTSVKKGSAAVKTIESARQIGEKIVTFYGTYKKISGMLTEIKDFKKKSNDKKKKEELQKKYRSLIESRDYKALSALLPKLSPDDLNTINNSFKNMQNIEKYMFPEKYQNNSTKQDLTSIVDDIARLKEALDIND